MAGDSPSALPVQLVEQPRWVGRSPAPPPLLIPGRVGGLRRPGEVAGWVGKPLLMPRDEVRGDVDSERF